VPIDYLSLSTTPVNLLKGNDLVSQGTGFYYVEKAEGGQVLFLVTNYHVLTGSAPNDRKSPIGDNITFQFHESAEVPGKVKTLRLPLFTKSGKPLWITSSSFPEADLAVIPVLSDAYKDCKVSCISAEWAKPQMLLRPTTNVTLVGYPYGYFDTANALPIWKTGTIASEPGVDFEKKPLLLVDVAAFPGMSGSPVFAIASGIYERADGSAVTPGSVREFLGVYASMQMVGKNKYLEQLTHGAQYGIRDMESLQIGHVWKANLVLETIKSVNIRHWESEVLAELR
jgi:hypothetical protein